MGPRRTAPAQRLFPRETLAALAERGCRVSLDAQGLVRAPRLGPLAQDAEFDPGVLESVSVLKLSEEEASIVAGGRFDASTARSLGVSEILVTLGSHGEDVWVDGELTHLPTTAVLGVETTGAGDAFMVAYSGTRRRRHAVEAAGPAAGSWPGCSRRASAGREHRAIRPRRDRVRDRDRRGGDRRARRARSWSAAPAHGDRGHRPAAPRRRGRRTAHGSWPRRPEPLAVSDDAGTTWREAGGGLPPEREVAISAAHPDLVVYASATRLSVSADGGRFWRALEPELDGIAAVAWDDEG